MPRIPRSEPRRRVAGLGLALLLALAGPRFAAAQMVLPGAVAPTEAGAPDPQPRKATRPSGPALPPRASVVLPSSLAGHTLFLNGGLSQVTFEAHDKGLSVARLTLSGDLISNARESCRIEAPNTPIAVTETGRPDGIARIRLDFPACPIAFDVLDGAALVDPAVGVCEFTPANCRFNPAGLWGPPSGDLGADKAKTIERARTGAEAAVRANYKALAASTKDRPTIMGYAREQAQFSSTREEICRDYVGEGRHGFCATKVTEARAAMLRAKLGDAVEAKAERKAKRAGRVGLRP